MPDAPRVRDLLIGLAPTRPLPRPRPAVPQPQISPNAGPTASSSRSAPAFGPWAPPPSALAESAYEGLHLFARAARGAGAPHGRDVARALRGLALTGPRARVSVGADGRLRQGMYLAEATATGFAIRAQVASGTA
ncbi:ABC transporter substrate-binding protein [Streptomyces sp. S3(2020)]|uniref:ABC transporter substrate-binding protein n=1 Tax=Streptomyces sp. S3(2020) TaxID=2732044 RepID=UPI0014880833|nr:ABC transporter substrate-binding protein [Streptomyces sp. S3(2020)]